LLRSTDDNVVQAVVTAAGRLGSRSAAADVVPFLSGETWVQMAAIAALGQLRSLEAVQPLAAMLSDPFCGEMAAEALARIGGTAAARALAEYFVALPLSLAPEQWLPLLAQALVETEVPLRVPRLREMLSRHLESDDAAARALLALGPGDEDGRAIDIVVKSSGENDPLPPCLARRADLAECLLMSGAPAREWGYELYRRNPQSIAPEVVFRVIVDHPPFDPDVLAAIVQRIGDTATLIALHVNVAASRETVGPMLRKRRVEVRALFEQMPDLDRSRRLLLMDAAGYEPGAIAAGITDLEREEQVNTIGQLRGRRVLARLPWLEWLDRDHDTFARLLGEVVAQRGARELMPLVRRELYRDPIPALVTCAGAMRDRSSLPLVVAAISRCDPASRPDIFESIAAIGGTNARKVLHAYATCGNLPIERLASRALAQHATEDDCSLLRQLAASPDWAVRYHAAEALGEFPQPENLSALTTLAADPAAVVAQRARGWLNAIGSAA
jgi:HEAT repeat protein